jgi:hypothetical protein
MTKLKGDRATSATITIDEARAKLKELIHRLAPGGRGHHHREPAIRGEAGKRAAEADESAAHWSWPVQGDDYLHGPRLRRLSGGHEGVHGVKLLLGTHTFRWDADGDPRMSLPATALLIDPVNALFPSMATEWGIAIKEA